MQYSQLILIGLATVSLISCSRPSLHSVSQSQTPDGWPQETIRFLDVDGTDVTQVSDDYVQFNAPVNLEPIWPRDGILEWIEEEGMSCLVYGSAIDSPSGAIAVKRPIIAGDTFECSNFQFEVVTCIDACEAGIIREIGSSLNNEYLFDNRRGIVMINNVFGLSNGFRVSHKILQNELGLFGLRN